jgi:hypothetical protein
VKKIIWEILKLAWKAFKLFFWKWLRPILGKVLFFGVIFAALVTIVALLVAGAC